MAWNRKCTFECLDLAHCLKSYIFLLLIFSIFLLLLMFKHLWKVLDSFYLHLFGLIYSIR